MRELREKLTNRVRRRLLKIWETRGGGFYGFVAVVTFVYLEAVDAGGDLVAATEGVSLGFIFTLAIGHVVEAFVNGLLAAIWPVFWLDNFGVGLKSALLLGASYAGYRAVRPAVLRLLRPTDGLPAPLLDAPVASPADPRRIAH